MAAKKSTKGSDAGDFWARVKDDLQRSLKEGVEAVREGATFVRKKAEHLSDEGKRQYRIRFVRILLRSTAGS